MSVFEFDGKKFRIVKINSAISDEADVIQGKVYAENVKKGLLLDAELENVLRDRGVLKEDESIEEKAEELRAKLVNLEKELRSAQKEGRPMTKEEGKELALEMRRTRLAINSLDSGTQKNISTAESKASGERINYLIYCCILDDATGQRFWKSFEDYKNETNNELLREATKQVLTVNFEGDREAQNKLYENKWLMRAGFMDEKLRLINEDGKLITLDGKLIDEDGYFVNENGDRVDEFGNVVDKDGNLVAEDHWSWDN